MLEVQVVAVTRVEGSQYPTVILRHEDRLLFISIGPFEAAAIAWGMEDNKPARPMTHDLILNVLAGLGGEVKSVTVYNLENATFFAYLLVEQRDADGQISQVLRIDTRPSDGIAVAVRAQCPIYVAEEVMNQAGQDLERYREQLMGDNPGDDDEDDLDDDEGESGESYGEGEEDDDEGEDDDEPKPGSGDEF